MDASQFSTIFCQAVKMIDGPDGFFVHGVMVAEEPDLVGEIWDYASSKSNIEAWSQSIAAKTNGQSSGNLRSMHGDNTCAAGKFVSVLANDGQKLFNAVAEVVDPIDQEKCRKGVYSGFSIKAPYARKWRDGRYTRWTSGVPIETSLVDVPCIPRACFTMKMADGTEEIRKFQNEVQSEEENSMITVEELQKEVNAKFDTLTKAVTDIATKMTAAAAVAAKCMKSASECTDDGCNEHRAAKSAPITAHAIAVAIDAAVKGIDIKSALDAAISPINKAIETLTGAVAIVAGFPIPTAVKANGATVQVDKKDDAGVKDDKVAVKSISETAKTSASDAIKMVHAAGPSQVLTSRGLITRQQ